jgi:3-hydroxybutyryl-CoA dehydrogenase
MRSTLRAAVIGGGTMGADIAAIFVQGGWSAHIVEPARERWAESEQRVRHALAQLGGAAERAQITLHATLTELPWQEIAFVVECAPEKLALKQSIFAELAHLAPAAVPLASNSSSFPISDIGRGLATRERMLGLHFFMPAHLVPAVEVVRGEATALKVWEDAAALMRSLGKVPVRVKKDIPGFLANRLQHAMMREAFALIDAGLASAEDVDAAVRYGFGLRYLAAVPVLQKDIAGLDIHCAAAATMYPNLANNATPSPTLTALVAQGKLGMKTGEGFYRWTAESAAKEQARYEKTLLAALEILKAERETRGL